MHLSELQQLDTEGVNGNVNLVSAKGKQIYKMTVRELENVPTRLREEYGN